MLALILIVAGQCRGGSCGAAPAMPFHQPFVLPQPIERVIHVIDQDAIERARADGRAEGRASALAEQRAARKARTECVLRCGCSACEDGCRCASRPCGEDTCRCVTPRAHAAPPAELPTGVETDRISATPRYVLSGREVSRDEAVRSIEQLADDSAKPRLTLIGPAADRKALRKVIEADAAVKAQVLVQDYEPTHWAVSKHVKDGLTLYLQRPDGTEMMPHETQLTPPMAAGLRDRLKAALGLGPAPAPTPGPSPVPPPPAPSGPQGPAWWQPLVDDVKKIPVSGWAAIAALGALHLGRRKD